MGYYIRVKVVKLFFILLVVLNLNGCPGDGSQVKNQMNSMVDNESEEVQRRARRSGMDPNRMVDEFTRPPCPECDQRRGFLTGGGGGSLGVNVKSNCGYKFGRRGHGLNGADLRKTCRAVNNILDKGHDSSACFPSNCSTATWLALAKRLRNHPRMKTKMRCRPPRSFGSNYAMFVGSFGLKKFIERNHLGRYRQIGSRSKLEELAKKGWPKKGDFIQYDRRLGRRATGHAAQFHSFKRQNGKIKKICYWSSNRGTRGVGIQCENIGRNFISLGVGKI